MLDRLEILLSRSRRLVSRQRWAARLLGEPGAGLHPLHGPGLVMVQIEGLSEAELRAALAAGDMPFLRRLIEQEGHVLQPVFSGFPSITSRFQAELFYGDPEEVPASRYFDPQRNAVVSLSDPAIAAAMEDRLSRAGEGLLKDGSAWADQFTGGARDAHMCASDVRLAGPLGSLTRMQAAWLLLWHGWNLIRVAGGLVWLAGRALQEFAAGRLSRREFARELHWVPARAVVTGLMHELAVAGVALDTERGLPVIHANLLAYDEAAHWRGPESVEARRSLRAIDSGLRRVANAAALSRRRDYQFWVHSDHGQETGVAPARESVVELDARIRAIHAELTQGAAPAGPHRRRGPVTGARVRWLNPGATHTWYDERRHEDSTPAGEDRIAVVLQGTLGCVYVPGDPAAEFLERFARKLVEIGIPAVGWSGPEGPRLVTEAGDYALPGEALAYLGAGHPHGDAVAADLVRQIEHPAGGDLLLIGWTPQRAVTWSGDRGAHGGPGPNESSAFLVTPPEASEVATSDRELRPGVLREMAMRALRRSPRPPRMRSVARRPAPGGVTAPGRTLRIMTYNVHGCRGMDGVFAPHRIARVIAREQPDVICLQEVDRARARSGAVDQIQVIAEQLELEFDFHHVATVDAGTFGNAVLSPHPLSRVKAGPLPSAERVQGVLQLEPRGVLWVALELDGVRVNVLNTHLSILEWERRLQVEALLGPSWLGDSRTASHTILCGDFNAAPDSWAVRRLLERMRATVRPEESRTFGMRTWTGKTPLRRIDHVLVTDPLQVREVRVPRSRVSRMASDHLPVVVDLVCPAGPPLVPAAAESTRADH